VVDLLRGMIWDDVRIPYWYRQNILLFLNVTMRSDLIESLRHGCKPPLCVIHPELYSFKDRFFAHQHYGCRDLRERRLQALLDSTEKGDSAENPWQKSVRLTLHWAAGQTKQPWPRLMRSCY